jgi:tetratricopeptide (TPR) repeat protein
MEEDPIALIKKYKYPLIIVGIGILVYFNMLLNNFIWDDFAYIINSPQTHSFNLSTLFGTNIFNNTGQYRPLTMAYFSILYNLFSTNQFFYHLTQLTLHIVNVFLVYLIFKSFFKKKLALFLSLIFLIHPMQVESVSYISASGGILFFFFGLLALYISIKNKKSLFMNFLQLFLLLASLLTKEGGILFFPLIFIYLYLFRKKSSLSFALSSLVTLAVYFLVRSVIGKVFFTSRTLIPIARLNLSERLITMPQVVFYYLKTFFCPVSLAIDQQWVITRITFSGFYLPLLLDVIFFSVLITFGFYFCKKDKKAIPAYSFFLVWFMLGLVLYSQIIPSDGAVADRWFYFHIVGLLGIIGLILQNIKPTKANKNIFILLAVTSLLLLGVRTVIRNNDWENPVKLFRHDSAISDNFLIESELANALVNENKFNDALTHAEKSVTYFPNDLNLYNLGYIYEKMGNIQQAEGEYIKGLQAKHYLPDGHTHYSVLYVGLTRLLLYDGRSNEAKYYLEKGLKDYPDSGYLWMNLALADYNLHNLKDALVAAGKARQLLPGKETDYIYNQILNNQAINFVK